MNISRAVHLKIQYSPVLPAWVHNVNMDWICYARSPKAITMITENTSVETWTTSTKYHATDTMCRLTNLSTLHLHTRLRRNVLRYPSPMRQTAKAHNDYRAGACILGSQCNQNPHIQRLVKAKITLIRCNSHTVSHSQENIK